MNLLASIVSYVLSAELFLGGQARLTDLTPGIRKRAMDKAKGYQQYLPIIPIRDPKRHSEVIGILMCLAGGLLLLRSTRRVGSVLSGSLSGMGWYAQSRMGRPYWLPVVNTVFAVVIFFYA